MKNKKFKQLIAAIMKDSNLSDNNKASLVSNLVAEIQENDDLPDDDFDRNYNLKYSNMGSRRRRELEKSNLQEDLFDMEFSILKCIKRTRNQLIIWSLFFWILRVCFYSSIAIWFFYEEIINLLSI